jgi:ferredoxin-NADP reductase
MWHTTPIVGIREIAPNVRQFLLENPGLDFKSGQFITMDLPIGEKRIERWRSYSVASAPHQEQPFELCIVRSESGTGTRYLFDTATVGTEIKWKGPDGVFVLPSRTDQDLVMVCTGTGIAPFRSMLLDMLQRQHFYRSVHLIFGTRTEADILYRAEMEALKAQIPHFSFDVALSRQPDWAEHRGYVHSIYEQRYAEPYADVTFMLCGWSRMIDEAVLRLRALGYGDKQVVYELYG